MMKHPADRAARNLASIRKNRPLIHSITNLVAMNYTANALLAMGAAPIMAHDRNEVAEIVSTAAALVLNLGTLSEAWLDSMLTAGQKASQCGIPIILDPVGAGASALRTAAALRILRRTDVSVIRGNASEILSLSDDPGRSRGVDTAHAVEDAAEAALKIATGLNATLAVTGSVDMVTDGKRVVRIHNGHPMMTYVTGLGCAASATIAAFAAVDRDPFSAAVGALAYVGICGEIAAHSASAPGSFAVQFLDALFAMTPETLKNRCHIET
jgi:hydroxyethylthiazole kinase